jgi:hypothetical protein
MIKNPRPPQGGSPLFIIQKNMPIKSHRRTMFSDVPWSKNSLLFPIKGDCHQSINLRSKRPLQGFSWHAMGDQKPYKNIYIIYPLLI